MDNASDDLMEVLRGAQIPVHTTAMHNDRKNKPRAQNNSPEDDPFHIHSRP